MEARRGQLIIGTALAVLAITSCGSSRSIDPITEDDTGNCHLAAISVPSTATPACPPITPGCPKARRAGAKTLLEVSSCSFGHDATDCVPVLNPICPTSSIVIAATLVNPNTDVPRDSCAADLHVEAVANSAGGADINWEAQEFRRSGTTCEPAGPAWNGHAAVSGPCCQTVTDIPFPTLRFTYRLVLRTDWQ